jgi:hypothetical protein
MPYVAKVWACGWVWVLVWVGVGVGVGVGGFACVKVLSCRRHLNPLFADRGMKTECFHREQANRERACARARNSKKEHCICGSIKCVYRIYIHVQKYKQE